MTSSIDKRPALVTSPRPSANDPEVPLARHSPYGRWRVATLIAVYVLMAAHIVHWHLAGKTLAPLELHEVMYTAELGVVTAGFLFMTLAVVLTAIFGRFFCGWGCHLLALQDLSAWILRKLGIRSKPIRARIIVWAPLLVMLYMFVWPQLQRIWAGTPHPGLRIADDSEAIASFTTTNFWRNLPDPWVSALTFLVCGGIAIYVLGSRGFCTFACPYGVIFRAVDRLAPGKIRVDDKCVQCGTCTKVCSSGIQVHDQVRTYGAVVDPRCLKDLDCVGACPHDALSYGFGLPSLLLKRAPGEVPQRPRFDFSTGEEITMALAFLSTLVVFRGLYDAVPFLMSVGLGAIASYTTVLLWRLCRRTEVRLGKQVIKTGGKCRPIGRWFAVAAIAFALLWVDSAIVQLARSRGGAHYAEAITMAQTARGPAARQARDWLEIADAWSLLATANAKTELAWAKALAGDSPGATAALGDAVHLAPQRADLRHWYAGALMQTGDRTGAIRELREATRLAPEHGPSHARLGQLLQAIGQLEEGLREVELGNRLSGSTSVR